MPESDFPHLFSPIQLGGLRLSHRMMMGSMHTGLEDGWGASRKLAAFYAERVRGGVELIVTGGVSPNFRGRLALSTSQLSHRFQIAKHRFITDRVHGEGGHICLQILHAGRYAVHPFAQAPSPIRSPISRFTPAQMSARQIRRTIEDFVSCAELAMEAGYDGVEVMGSEGYLINQFLCTHSNERDDDWGGRFGNRMRFPVEIIRGMRSEIGDDPLIIYRISLMDLLEQGSDWSEVTMLAQGIEKAGADVLSSGYGWHEVRIPTIAASVPRAAFSWVTQRLRTAVEIPVITSNRINDPGDADRLIEQGHGDMVSMARPFLADADLVTKSQRGESGRINTCIACNQGCLDRVFKGERATCLVNPRACFETELQEEVASVRKRIAVIGLGPAGVSCAINAAKRGHEVTAYDRGEIGGQFNLAASIPGKEEFEESLRYFRSELEQYRVDVRTACNVDSALIAALEVDEIVLATGVRPRWPDIDGNDHPSVMSYVDYLSGRRSLGHRVVIIGAGGIGFDVATRVVAESNTGNDWYAEWGIDRRLESPGGLVPEKSVPLSREIFMLQRKDEKPGRRLAKTTGWIHRVHLRRSGVQMLQGVVYRRIDDDGVWIERAGVDECVEADSVIICTGQESQDDLLAACRSRVGRVHIIGGAERAAELDAERAIRQGTELGLRL